jgi:molybdate transport system ATP-binding protein
LLRIKALKRLRDYTLDVDLLCDDGTLVLMGNNGSGKTTVLNLAAGLMKPDSGVIEVSGRKLFDSDAGVDVPIEDRNVGYVFQNYALFPHMSVFDNVAFGLRMRKAPDVEEKVRAELESLDMWELRKARASRLSGGQKQKVALARCLAIKPSMLLLDEPLSALDAEMQSAMRAAIKMRIGKGRLPTVIVSHCMIDAVELGDRVYVIEKGKVTINGEPGEVFKKGKNRFIDSFFG